MRPEKTRGPAVGTRRSALFVFWWGETTRWSFVKSKVKDKGMSDAPKESRYGGGSLHGKGYGFREAAISGINFRYLPEGGAKLGGTLGPEKKL